MKSVHWLFLLGFTALLSGWVGSRLATVPPVQVGQVEKEFGTAGSLYALVVFDGRTGRVVNRVNFDTARKPE